MSHGFDCPGIDGDNGNNDASEEKRGQLVDIFHSYKHHHSHQGETDRAVHSHVVQHGTVSPMGVCSMKNSRLGHQIFLRRNKIKKASYCIYIV